MVHCIYILRDLSLSGYSFKKIMVFHYLKIDFDDANSADPDKNSAFCGILSGSSLFAKVTFKRKIAWNSIDKL